MTRIFNALRGVPVAALAAAALLLVVAGVVLASGSSPPEKVCVPTKEGKPVVTPKSGACKTGSTLTELGANPAQEAKIAGLESAIGKLEAKQTPVPITFTFFSGHVSAGETSPVFDASGYTTVVVTTGDCTFAIHGDTDEEELQLEVSNDDSVFLREGSWPCNSSTGTRSYPVSGRYYRMSAPGLSGNAVAVAQFSA
jgi:hypothetical protein